MYTRKELVDLLSACLCAAFVQPVHGSQPDYSKLTNDELKRLVEQAARAKAYRQLTEQEVKKALAVPVSWRTAAIFLNPGFKTGAPLPAGVTLEHEGYFISVNVNETTYSFLKAETPAGKEVLFACPSEFPWPTWIDAQGLCGVAVVDAPVSKRDQMMKEYAQYSGAGPLGPGALRETPAWREYINKLKPQFEVVLHHCSTLEPGNDLNYEWYASISTKGRVARSKVTGYIIPDDPSSERSPYKACIDDGMKALDLPKPPIDAGRIMWWGGWPVAVEWIHGVKGDKVL